MNVQRYMTWGNSPPPPPPPPSGGKAPSPFSYPDSVIRVIWPGKPQEIKRLDTEIKNYFEKTLTQWVSKDVKETAQKIKEKFTNDAKLQEIVKIHFDLFELDDFAGWLKIARLCFGILFFLNSVTSLWTRDRDSRFIWIDGATLLLLTIFINGCHFYECKKRLDLNIKIQDYVKPFLI